MNSKRKQKNKIYIAVSSRARKVRRPYNRYSESGGSFSSDYDNKYSQKKKRRKDRDDVDGFGYNRPSRKPRLVSYIYVDYLNETKMTTERE